MFTIRAGYSDKVEVKSSLEKARAFFGDIKNFVELMPSVESIYTDAKGVSHWTIRADIPFVGSMMQKFAVEQAKQRRAHRMAAGCGRNEKSFALCDGIYRKRKKFNARAVFASRRTAPQFRARTALACRFRG